MDWTRTRDHLTLNEDGMIKYFSGMTTAVGWLDDSGVHIGPVSHFVTVIFFPAFFSSFSVAWLC